MMNNATTRNTPVHLGGIPRAFQADLNPKQFLVEPCNRLRIAIALTSISIIILWGIDQTLHVLKSPLFHNLSEFSYFARDTMYGLMTGGIWGGAQWYFLRRYIPTPNWIIATAVGWSFSSSTRGLMQDTIRAYSVSFLDSASAIAKDPPPFSLLIVVNILSLLVIGLLQWLLLRRYVKSALGWPFLPFLVLLLLSITANLQLKIQEKMLLPLIIDVSFLHAGLWGLLPAIYLCILYLHRVSLEDTENSVSSLAQHPEIQRFTTLRKIRLNLFQKLHRNWNADLSGKTTLIYLVGVSKQGNIQTYKPADSFAAQQVNQTPLSVMLPENGVLADPSMPLARMLVSFSAPAHLEVRSLQSFPLWKIAGTLCFLLLVISCYPLWGHLFYSI